MSSLLTEALSLCNLAAVGIFGILLSAAFCPIRWTGKKRWALAGCTAGLLALQCVFIYAPFMHIWFDSAPIGLAEWGRIFGMAVVVFLLVEVGKWVIRKVFDRR